MKAKQEMHTPGPWTCGQVRNTGVYDILGPDISGRGRELVGSFNASQSRLVNDNNASLIASAPELLAALEQMRDDWLTAFDNDIQEGNEDAVKILTDADVAIAKARGAHD